jgi:hypothetical protein
MLNTHDVAQSIAPDCRVVYVDNDPIVLAHARALLTNTTPEGVTTYVDADVRDIETIVSDARNVLNFKRFVRDAVVVLIVVLLPARRFLLAREGCSGPARRYMTLALRRRCDFPHARLGAGPT